MRARRGGAVQAAAGDASGQKDSGTRSHDAGCTRLDPGTVLRITPRTFALRVGDQSMIGAGLREGDVVFGEFMPEARVGDIVVALMEGETVLKRLVVCDGRPSLVSDRPNRPAAVPLSEVVIQGVLHSVLRRL